jgi:K(+)-stimulated pyrophosphate-energized sodium pump
MLQSYVYAYCVASGIAAGVINGEINKAYSSNARVFRRLSSVERDIRNGQAVINSLAAGMISTFVPVILVVAAVFASYNFASYYGIALSAVGMGSVTCINSAVRGFAINARSSSEIIEVSIKDEVNAFPDILYTTAVRADSAGRTYSAVSAMLASFAMITAYIYAAGIDTVNLMNMAVLAGAAAGAMMVMVFTGLIISSTAITARVIRERRDYSEENGASNSLRGAIIPSIAAILVPVVIGAAGGLNTLAGFLTSFSITGTILVLAMNNSGKYYESCAAETLTTVIKLALAVSLVFMPVFAQLNGFLF